MKNRIISLFSGGGGLDLGFIAAGYDILWAIDNDINAVNTYKENIGNHIVHKDITKIPLENIPNADVVIGGPPCQSFSLTGNRNVEDKRGKLVWNFLHIIERIQPRAFVFENVTGLQSAKTINGEKIIDLLKSAFQSIGYTISMKIMNSADYGVPQKRKRIIIVGLNSGVYFDFPKPTHDNIGKSLKKYISVKEALDDLPNAIVNEKELIVYTANATNDYQRKMRTTGEISEHFIPNMSDLDKYIISHVKPGGNYMDIPKNAPSKRIRRLQKEGGHTTCYGRMHPEKPSYTINTYFNRPNVGCNIHYRENRLITVREALRIQSFPDNFKIVSSTKKGKNLIVGNAVPPILAEIIATSLKKYL